MANQNPVESPERHLTLLAYNYKLVVNLIVIANNTQLHTPWYVAFPGHPVQ